MRYTVVIIGGMMSWPHRYEEMRRTIADLSGGDEDEIAIAPLYPIDWAKLFRLEGWDRLLKKLESHLLDRSAATGNQALIVGHSLGGVIGKLLAEHARIRGIEYRVSGSIAAVVGLGSPLNSRRVDRTLKYRKLVSESMPTGAACRYLAVTGSAVSGDPHGSLQQRYAYQAYRWHVGRGDLRGDLLIPESAMLDEGLRSVSLEGVYHEKFVAANWYGSDLVVRQWWPSLIDFLDD